MLTTEDRIELARSFAAEHFVSKGLAAQLDVHAPHRDRGEGEGGWADGTGGNHTNWHAHLLITTRRIEGDHLFAKKARDLDPQVRKAGTRALVTDAEAWGETWRAPRTASSWSTASHCGWPMRRLRALHWSRSGGLTALLTRRRAGSCSPTPTSRWTG